MTKKLNNLLNFKDYETKDSFVLKSKTTKRTESGLDVLLEHHIDDRDEQIEYILDNIEDLDDDIIEKIYKKVEKGLGVQDEDDEDIDDEDIDDEDFDEDDEDINDIDDEDFNDEFDEDDEEFIGPNDDEEFIGPNDDEDFDDEEDED